MSMLTVSESQNNLEPLQQPLCDDSPLMPIGSLMKELGLSSIPEHQTHPSKLPSTRSQVPELSQLAARKCLANQGLDISRLDDLGNGWSTRWSTKKENKNKESQQRIILQCQSGSCSNTRKSKQDEQREIHSQKIYEKQWKRKMPYDFTACLAHVYITYTIPAFQIIRITGVLEHNEACKNKLMKRLPPVPLHKHVYQIALEQINNGASIDAVQKRNQELFQAGLYHGQNKSGSEDRNVRYVLLKHDLRSLYRQQAKQFGIDIEKPPELNIESWLNPASLEYKKELADVVFYYRARTTSEERFKICLQTADMKEASWKYSHKKQLIFDGTFGICDRRLLLFIALGVDHEYRGVPLAFFLFSAPTGAQATHAGYDTDILFEVLNEWVKSMGQRDNEHFAPNVVITDMDLRERGALLKLWPGILMLLCKFHVRQCWTNQRKTLVKIPQIANFSRQLLLAHLHKLEEDLIRSQNYNEACSRIRTEEQWLQELSDSDKSNCSISGAMKYLKYLTRFWLQQEMWESWSEFGRIEAARKTGIPLKGILPTTNHLESFNGVLKSKYIRRYQRNGHRIRFDMLIYLMTVRILPGIFKQRNIEHEYYSWLSKRFEKESGGINLLTSKQPSQTQTQMESLKPVTWWCPEHELNPAIIMEIKYIMSKGRICTVQWKNIYTIIATCASRLANMKHANYERYTLEINCHGKASCTCLFNQGGHGACKHLWALRFLLPQFHPIFIFYFPSTQDEAQAIYNKLDKYSTDTSAPNPEVPPQNILSILATEANAFIEEVQPESEKIVESDVDGSSTSSSDIEERLLESAPLLQDTHFNSLPPSTESSTSRIALTYQLHNRIDREISAILPHLHGLNVLLKDLTDLPKDSQLAEFGNIISQLHSETSRILSNNTRSSRAFGMREDIQHHILPPSPERAQKRKRSTATY